MSDKVIYRASEGVAEVRLNRPEKKNAILGEMYAAMADGVLAAEADPAVRVLIIGAEGGSFTAGNDLTDFLNRPKSEEEPPVRRFMLALSRAEKPVVAAVDGLAIGIGTTLLLHCDLVVASTRSRFQMPFVNLGLVPEFASSWLLPARIGYQRAAELLLLAESMDAPTAKDFGLVNRVVAPAEVDATALDLARRLAAKPPEAVRQSKRLMRADPDSVLQRMNTENAEFSRLLASPEAREAFTAFLEKRAPDFSKVG